MIPHKMISRHDPDRGQYGDCLRACVASLLDCFSVVNVPHFADDNPDGQELWDRVRLWLNQRHNLTVWITPYEADDWHDVTASVNASNPNMFYMLIGASIGGDHIVICKGDEIVHDPAPMGSGLHGPASNGMFAVVTFVSNRLVA